MGIFRRIKTIAVADINNLLDKVEDPVSMLKQYIRELEEQIDEARNALSHQLFVERKFEALIGEAEAAVAKRSRQTELAVERNEEHIAELAIQDKLFQQSKLESYRSQYEEVKRQTAILLDEIRNLKEVYQELTIRKDYLISRIHAAQAVQSIHSTLKSYNPEQVRRGFARIEERVWKMDADAQAGSKVNQILQISDGYGQEDAMKARVRAELDKLKEQKKGSA